jgi:AbrB family looped-hinge helix DNA binding protein
MSFASSKLTAQGQISVPVEVRRKLGLAPGSVLEWEEDGERVVVRRAGTHSSEEIHAALFPKGAPPKSLSELKAGLRSAVTKRHARR